MFAFGIKHSTCIAKKEYHQHDEQLNRILIEMNGIAQAKSYWEPLVLN